MIFTVAESVPPRLVAEIVKFVADKRAVGVPESTPVIVLNVSPDGSDGEIAQLEAAPPLFTPFKLTAVKSFSNVNVDGEIAISGAGGRTLAKLKDAVLVPDTFVPVTVYVRSAKAEVDVPLIRPLLVLNESPAGKDGEIAQLVVGPPVFVGTNPAKTVPTVAMFDDGEYENAGAGTLNST